MPLVPLLNKMNSFHTHSTYFTNYFSRQTVLLEQFCILFYIPYNFLCIKSSVLRILWCSGQKFISSLSLGYNSNFCSKYPRFQKAPGCYLDYSVYVLEMLYVMETVTVDASCSLYSYSCII